MHCGDFCLFVSLTVQTEPSLYFLSGCGNRTPQAVRLHRNHLITSLSWRLWSEIQVPASAAVVQGLPLCARVARGKEHTLYRLVSGDSSPLGGGATLPRRLPAS